MIVHVPCEKANLLSSVFDSKQSDSEVTLPHSCVPEPKLKSFAFRSSEVKTLLDELDSYGSAHQRGFFPLFFKKVSNLIAPKLCVIFRILIQRGSFPLCWRNANVTPIPKGVSATPLPQEYRPISITRILSKVFERLLAKRLMNFFEKHNLLPSSQFGFRKGLGTCDALLINPHSRSSILS